MDSSIKHSVVILYAIFTAILLSILLFQIFRLNYVKNSVNKSKPLFHCLRLSDVAYVILTLPLIRCILLTSWHLTPSILNTNTCQAFLNIDAAIWFAVQGFIHLFVAMRSRLNTTEKESPTIWFKIGLSMLSFDFFSVIYVAIGYGFDAEHTGNSCKPINVSIVLIVGNMCSTVIIGLYSLVVFVIPLRKYIKIEKDITKTDTAFLRVLVSKIILYSTIMIITTLITACIVGAVGDQVELITAFDNIINNYCIMLQFRDIDIADVNSKFVKQMVSFFQCKYCVTFCCCLDGKSMDEEINLARAQKIASKTDLNTAKATISVDNKSKNGSKSSNEKIPSPGTPGLQ